MDKKPALGLLLESRGHSQTAAGYLAEPLILQGAIFVSRLAAFAAVVASFRFRAGDPFDAPAVQRRLASWC